MDHRDSFLQTTFPTIPVPRFGSLEELASNGHRFLVGSNGVALEVRRPWLYMRKIAMKNESGLALPYGSVSEVFELRCGPIPRELLMEFAWQAKAWGEIETAAWITWRESTRSFVFRRLSERTASAHSVVVDRPALDADEHLVVDLHSHGLSDAFFSPTDNEDDQGEVKFSVVVGSCHRDRPEAFDVVARLCALGLTVPANEAFSLKEVQHAA
ncbi:PRTRC system protein A [Burkholderia vietnamiensis]|uniref:PRTRC system protein A n=1 Tax=Burkholderia vietnamiensis TaxID=60552 RepID=UPI00158D4BB9|nr:PRTRC system protein A [Burkholderia vietnamiensis]